MMLDLKILLPMLLCGIVLGFCGGRAVSQSEIHELKEEHLHLVAEIQQKTNEEYSRVIDELKSKQDALNKAMDERDKAVAAGRGLRADADRLRQQLAAASRDLRKKRPAGGCTCESQTASLSYCFGLLSEGVGLAAEGAELSLRLAAERDAAASLLK